MLVQMEREKKDGGEELLTHAGNVSHCHAGWNTILVLRGLRIHSHLEIPIWDTDRSFGTCSDWPTGFLAAVFALGCFEAGFTSCSLVPTAPSSAARQGWWPRDPIPAQHWDKTEGQVSPKAYPGFSYGGTHLCTDSWQDASWLSLPTTGTSSQIYAILVLGLE